MLKDIWNWIVTSSSDPQKFSLTVKAGIPFVVALAQVLGHPIDTTALGAFGDAVVNVIVLLVALVTGLMTAFGAGRKVVNTIAK